MSYRYLLDLALILLSTKLLGLVTQRFHMPQVVGALLAGLLLGPAGLNVLGETEFFSQISELGVIVILFTAGISTDLRELKEAGKAGFLVALCGVLIPLVMGVGFGWAAAALGWLPGTDLLECVFLGTILTATSVSITVEALKELGRLDTKVGSTILAAALIDDVLGLVALTVVSSLAGRGNLLLVLGKIVLFFVFAAGVAFAAVRLFRWMISSVHGKNLRRYPVLAFVLCLLMAYCAEAFFGVADIIGAFAAGLVVGATSKAKYIEAKFVPLSYLLLTPVFFASIGMKVELPDLSANVLLFSLALLLVAVLSKLAGCGLGARLCGFTPQESVQVGVGMACRGEVALIVANRGLSMGVLQPVLMTPVVITVVGCAVLTPVLLKAAFRTYPHAALQENGLADRYREVEQLDIVAARLLDEHRDLRERGGNKP